jgi:uncharacterized protein YbjT (DUF2867 family)
MNSGPVTVFGGTGFLGSRVVKCLAEKGSTVRVAARNPWRSKDGEQRQNVVSVEADVRNIQSVQEAVDGASAVVNCVGLYHEHDDETFEAVHLDGAADVAKAARKAGVERLVHISGIGVDTQSGSLFVRTRALAETRVFAAFAEATIVRPSVMFAKNGSFLQALEGVFDASPVVPLFGNGETRLQPAHVDDIADAISALLEHPETAGTIYEFGGSDILTYRELLEGVRKAHHARSRLVPMPFTVWKLLARLMSVMRNPPITTSQVALMQNDNVVDPNRDGFNMLGIRPRSIKSFLHDATSA